MHLTHSRIIFLIGIGTAVTNASPITYDINFTLTQGSPNATSGTFTYDASQPTGSQFTNFIVQWDTLTFDLTSAANDPTELGTGCTAGANSSTFFALLSGTAECSPPIPPRWEGNTFPTKAHFNITEATPMSPPTGGEIYADDVTDTPITTDIQGASGSFNITPTSPVPEPTTGYLMLTCCVGLARALYVRGKRSAR